MASAAYTAYIISPEWRARRAAFMGIRGNGSCRICRARKRLHVHHLSYAHLGDEPDEDLVTLCEAHHALVHEFHRSSKMTLRAATLYIVKREKGRPAPVMTLKAPPRKRRKPAKRRKSRAA